MVADVVDTTGTQLFPRREELTGFSEHVEAVMADIRRLLADHFESSAESEDLVARRLGDIAGGLDALRASVDELRAKVDELEAGREASRRS
jgi:hypothetical protein